MKSSVHASAVLSALLAIVPVLLAPGIAAAKPDGTSVFKEKCSMCHGPDGKGFPALKTPDFTDPKWQASITDDKIIETIKNGKKGTPMPAFSGKLSDDEITAVKDYVRSLGKK